MERAPEPIARVVLLGYMCSGKSTVGRSLARRLEWEFLDFDIEIERREGGQVWEIIEARGAAYFRELEAELTTEAAKERRLVMAPGGGWITTPSLLDSIRAGTLSIWLQVSPEETLARVIEDPAERPLKHHPDPIKPITSMLREREPLYRLADVMVPGDGRSSEEIAFEVEQLIRTRG